MIDKNKAAKLLFGLALMCLLPVIAFSRCLFWGEVPAFRDVFAFYYPYWSMVVAKWYHGVPLWNASWNAGEPMLASGTSIPFYPGIALLFLPVGFPLALTVFLVFHLLIAACGMYLCARRIGVVHSVAMYCGIAYSCSGAVLSQYCNPVFLVGASLLPFAVAATVNYCEHPGVVSAIMVALPVALMIVGGDPQMAVNLAICIVLYLAVTLLRGQGMGSGTRNLDETEGVADFVTRLKDGFRGSFGFAGIFLLAGGLAAVQILPSMELKAYTTRAESQVPRNVYELVRGAFVQRNRSEIVQADTGRVVSWYDSLIGRPPPPAKHQMMQYSWSETPTRYLGLFWPHSSGQIRPTDTTYAWVNPQTWQPTLYCGLMTALFCVHGLFCRPSKSTGCELWIRASVIVFALGSFGYYGPGYLWNLPKAYDDPLVKLYGGVGGVYWLFTVCVPTFSDFRYPAKLCVPFTCFATLLAGLVIQKHLSGIRLIKPTLLLFFVILSIGLLTIHLLLKSCGFDPLGVLKVDQGWALDCSLGQCILVGIAGYVLLYRLPIRKPRIEVFLLALLLVDLSVAMRGIVSTREINERAQNLLTTLIELERPSPERRPRMIVSPALKTHGSIESELIFNSQWSIASGLTKLGSPATHELINFSSWFDLMVLDKNETPVRSKRAFDVWGGRYLVVPSDLEPGRENSLDTTNGLVRRWRVNEFGPVPTGEALAEDKEVDGKRLGLRFLRNDAEFPPCWFVKEWSTSDPILNEERARWVPLMTQLAFWGGEYSDLRTTAHIELSPSDADILRQAVSMVANEAGDSAEVIRYSAERIVYKTSCREPRILVMSELWYPGWKCRILKKDGSLLQQPIFRANFSMRAVPVPAGESILEFSYEPESFFNGAAISIGSCLLVVALSVRCIPSTRRSLRSLWDRYARQQPIGDKA